MGYSRILRIGTEESVPILNILEYPVHPNSTKLSVGGKGSRQVERMEKGFPEKKGMANLRQKKRKNGGGVSSPAAVVSHCFGSFYWILSNRYELKTSKCSERRVFETRILEPKCGVSKPRRSKQLLVFNSDPVLTFLLFTSKNELFDFHDEGLTWRGVDPFLLKQNQ